MAARPPVEVKPGRTLILRFHTEDRPANLEIRGPGGLLSFTLQPNAPDGQVTAWDARFEAPRAGRRYAIGATAAWPHEDCVFPGTGAPPPDQFAEWGFSVKKRPGN